MKSVTSKVVLGGLVLLVFMFIAGAITPVQAVSEVVAFDMVGSTSQNLDSHTNAFAGAFTSSADGFEKYQRGVSSSIPFAVADDSLSIYTGDEFGIIKEGNTDVFFGVADTENNDNSGPVDAEWVFDISGYDDLVLSIDIGAMGDFETSDYFVWSYNIDGGSETTAFASTVDDAGSHTYTLEGGAEFTLNDPMLLNGLILDNNLQTFFAIVEGTGSKLNLTLTAEGNGGDEGTVFQNIVIESVEPEVFAFDMVGSASQNLDSYTNPWTDAFGSDYDGFQKYQRWVSDFIPYQINDDSLSIYTGDELGIIKEGNTDIFFGATDTENGDNTGPVSAEWVFDVDGYDKLFMYIDIGAMGDFEATGTVDYFEWSYNFDGGTELTAFASTVDDTTDHTYTMEGGAEVTLNDPMLLNGVTLTNDLQTFTVNLNGSGSKLNLTLTLQTDGGSEAIAFQNIVLQSGGDVPPSVSSTNPADGDTDVPVNTNIEINFNEEVDVAGDWFDIDCVYSGNLPASVSGGPQDYVLDPIFDLETGDLCTVTIYASQVTDKDDVVDNMQADYDFSFLTYLPPSVCGQPANLISDIQGPGDSSPAEGALAVVEGVVVGDFQEGDELKGFFVQEENADHDPFEATSEGIFVYEGSSSPSVDVNMGQRVRVTGTVDEYKTLTQIEDVSQILDCGTAGSREYKAAQLTLPESYDGELERYEGMYVQSSSRLYVVQNYFLGRYGQMTLSGSDRLFNPTNNALPGSWQAEAIADHNARSLLFLDDGVDYNPCGDNPDPVPYLGAPPPAVIRAGDKLRNLVGVLDYGQINNDGCYSSSTLSGRDYRVHPTQEPTFKQDNFRTDTPEEVGGDIKVASFNVLNFFNGDGMGGGFPTSRGADSFNEFVRQRIKIYEAMKAVDGDIVGLMEIENDGYDPYSAIAEMVKILNEGPCWDSPTECADLSYYDPGMGAGTYAFVDPGAGDLGTDEIAVGLLYKPAAVSTVGSPTVVDEVEFTDPNNLGSQKNRPALIQTFADADGAKVTIVVNHLKSKGSGCGVGDDDPVTGQGSCNLTRTLAVDYLVNTLLPTDPTGSGDSDFLIIGDLNAYALEDPMIVLRNARYQDLVRRTGGYGAYTYVFDGLLGYLDHALASRTLTRQVTRTTVWHINADEALLLGYDEDYNPVGYYNPDQFRASDHDPVIVGLNLR